MSKKKPNGETGETAPEAASAAAPELVDAEALLTSALLAEKDAEIAKLRSDLLYERAELDNFKRRTEKRCQDMLRFASESLIRDLLPVLDNLERAALHANGSDAVAMAEGVGHIAVQLRAALEKSGVAEVAAEGAKFDPHLHEALAQVPGEEDNKVAAVHEKGYTLHERLLRPSRVLVSRLASRENGD